MVNSGTLPRLSPRESLGENVCAYGQDHSGILRWAEQYVGVHRDEIGIEEPWSILLRITCPTRLSPAHKAHEASIEWDSEVWFARVDLICNLPFLLRQWVLIHELYELKHWRTGDGFHDLVAMIPPSELREVLRQRFYAARNQEIEQEVGQYLGFRRPNHIVSAPLVVQEKEETHGEQEDITDQVFQAYYQSKQHNNEEEAWPNMIELTEEEMENIRL